MASWNPFIEDLTENFFMCSVCLDQFNEPKQLPCLHRYCNDCLRTVIQASHDGTIKCPLCKQRFCIPEDGLDGFKTDFHMKSMLEFIELHKSLDKKDLKQCVSCSKDVAKKIKAKLAECNDEHEKGAADIENRRKRKITVKHEEKMNPLIMKYEENMTITDDQELKEFKETCQEIEDEFSVQKLGELDSNFKTLTTAKDLLTSQNKDKCEEILNKCQQLIKRFENLSATSSSILACNDDWTDAQCVPDIRAASEPILEEMKQEYPELESLSDFVISDIAKVISDRVVITESAESVVDVAGIKADGYDITGVTSSSNGYIVMTGSVSKEESDITVIKMKSDLLYQNVFNRNKRFRIRAARYCCPLPGFNVITVCIPDEIGIYNISDSSYQKKNISDMVKTWPKGRYVLSVTTNPAKNEIIVGTNSREVYVFDYQLNYSHSIVLPDVIKESDDITVHDGNLLICDYVGRSSYEVTMVAPGSKAVVYKFTKPSEANINPTSVCIGMGGFIYILWHDISGRNTMLTQYSGDGRHLLSSMPVEYMARCITTSVVDGEEKLVIATFTRKIYMYGLVPV
ncbi:uncharacterized protein [Apostichopus japonicus]|uniref:uncharacterized protein n=1 Tax=Stichopus japonicus TaxID=307972 RepID=UPI003AB1E044